MSESSAFRRLLPSKSGCLFLLLLGTLIVALTYGIFWTLMNVPEGSNSTELEQESRP